MIPGLFNFPATWTCHTAHTHTSLTLNTCIFRPKLELTDAIKVAQDFIVDGYKILAKAEQLRVPRILRLGLVQNAIVAPTTHPVDIQREALYTKIRDIAYAANQASVAVLGLQEAWCKFGSKIGGVKE